MGEMMKVQCVLNVYVWLTPAEYYKLAALHGEEYVRLFKLGE